MLYTLGTASDLQSLNCTLPSRVRTELFIGLNILDIEYGKNRNPQETGGFSVLIESKEDIPALMKIINFERHPPEWVTKISTTDFTASMFVMNDDFSIIVYMPISILPTQLLKELED